MAWGLIIAGLGSALGGGIAGSGAQSAGKKQAQRNQQALANSQAMFNTIQGNEKPYMESGGLASEALQNLLGIGSQSGLYTGTHDVYTEVPGYNPGVTEKSMYTRHPGLRGLDKIAKVLEPVAAPLGLGTIAPYYNEADKKFNPNAPAAGMVQKDGKWYRVSQEANPLDTSTFNQGTYGQLLHKFNTEDFYNNIDPGYQWRLQQGQQALQNSQAAGSGILSGAALKSLNDYTQGSASQEFSNAFNRYTTQQNNIFSRLSQIASLGQNAASMTGNQGVGIAGQQSQALANIGGALASGTAGAANAYANTAGSLGGLGWLYAMNKGGNNNGTTTGVPISPGTGGSGDYSTPPTDQGSLLSNSYGNMS